MNRVITGLLLSLFVSVASLSYARIPVYFGESDYLEKIEPSISVDVGAEGGGYRLGYRTYIRWFVGGVYLKDEGYVLIASYSNEYIPLDNEAIKTLQTKSLLPDPLPSYSISAMQYAKGFSLWLVLIALAVYGFVASKKDKKKQAT